MILVAIGANLFRSGGQAPEHTCLDAVAALRRLPRLEVAAVSRWFRSAPVPPGPQPDYVNGVVRLEAEQPAAEPEPAVLLAALQRIEQAMERVRGVPNAARTLDLDIVAMGPEGGLLRPAPDPVLPHPRATIRAFVLLPLRDVAPDWRDPASGRTAAALLAALDPADLAGCRPLDVR